MTQFLGINFTEYNIHRDYDDFNTSLQNKCACCLNQNVKFVNLKTCKHAEVLQKLFDCRASTILLCCVCHNILRKFDLFRKRVKENMCISNSQLKSSSEAIYSFQRSNLEITSTINSLALQTEIKIESKSSATVFNAQIGSHDLTTEVKVEHEDISDFETDVPLSLIKKEIKKVKVKKKRKTVTPADRLCPEKYTGKIRIVTLTEEELVSERACDRGRDSYKRLPYRCDDCVTGFDHELTLKDHLEKRHTQICMKNHSFVNVPLEALHNSSYKSDKTGSFTCDICRSVLNTVPSYKEHCKRHYRRYECEECGRRNNTLHATINHYNETHGTIDTTYTCHKCGFTTNSHRSYRYHKDKHKEKQQCTECGSTFVNKTGLRAHMFTVHKLSSRIYSCAACSKVYAAKSGLLAHAQSVHGGAGARAYCAHCRTQFRTETNLRHHLRTHSAHVRDDDKRFVCDDCGSKFLTKPSLQEHTDFVHLKNNKYGCTKCSKVFKNKSALRKHKNYVHDKKRPPRNKICDHCGRCFTTMSILRSHIRTHTGERPLRCAHCPATFAHSAALYTHNKLLHGDQ